MCSHVSVNIVTHYSCMVYISCYNDSNKIIMMNLQPIIELYDKEVFSQNDINLSFLKTHEISYKQFNNEFVPNLSIIDILMFNDKEQIKEILTMNELI